MMRHGLVEFYIAPGDELPSIRRDVIAKHNTNL